MTEIRILIVEDEPIIAEDIASSIQKNEYTVSAIVYDKEGALEQLKNNTPDFVILDINLNGKEDGIDIAALIKKDYQIPFIFLTSYSDKDTINKAKHTEPSGYIVKPFSESSLYSTIEIGLYNYVQKNKNKYPTLSLQIINKQLPTALSQREFELIELIYQGNTNQQIAVKLFISMNTVKKHINHIYLKLDTQTRTESVAKLRVLMS